MLPVRLKIFTKMDSLALYQSVLESFRNSDTPESPEQALNQFLEGVKNYFRKVKVIYNWTAVSSSGTPDPQTQVIASIQPSTLVLSPSGATEHVTAINTFSSALNECIATWSMVFESTFIVSPALLVPAINISTATYEDVESALLSLCESIVNGINFPPIAGTHLAYTGTGVLKQAD